jgi:uncharacterized protein YukE
MLRSTKLIKEELAGIKAYILDLQNQIDEIKSTLKELNSAEYYDWKSMALANEKSAAQQGHWYLNSKTDAALLEQIISEINKNEDLCALLTTSDGTTVSLRVHPQPKSLGNKSTNYNKFSEDE